MKDGFKPVSGASKYKKWKDWSVGDYLVGTYLSKGIDAYEKNTYAFEVKEAKFKDGQLVTSGETFTLNANGSLDYKMEKVSEGQEVMVVYKGEEVSAKGPYKGKKFHNVEVLAKKGSEPVADTSESDSEIL